MYEPYTKNGNCVNDAKPEKKNKQLQTKQRVESVS